MEFETTPVMERSTNQILAAIAHGLDAHWSFENEVPLLIIYVYLETIEIY